LKKRTKFAWKGPGYGLTYSFGSLGPFFNKNSVDIKNNVQFLDVNTLAQAKAEGPKPRYREYPDD